MQWKSVRNRKKKTPKELKPIVTRAHRRGEKVVLANGCFDLLHIGHIRYLEGAKRLGRLLIVAVNSSASVRRLKGRGRPFMSLSDRVALISALSCVDYVTVFGGSTVESILVALKPNFHAKGADYTPETVPEKGIVRAYGGKVVIVGGPKVRSTTELIKTLKRVKR